MGDWLLVIITLPVYFVILYISARLVTYAYLRSRMQVAGTQFRRKEQKWRAGSNT
jgi:hypothetical protein